jgi:hypothetical protein
VFDALYAMLCFVNINILPYISCPIWGIMPFWWGESGVDGPSVVAAPRTRRGSIVREAWRKARWMASWGGLADSGGSLGWCGQGLEAAGRGSGNGDPVGIRRCSRGGLTVLSPIGWHPTLSGLGCPRLASQVVRMVVLEGMLGKRWKVHQVC